LAAAADSGIDKSAVYQLTLRRLGDRPVYALTEKTGSAFATVDAKTGKVVTRISAEQASAAALADFSHSTTVESVTLLEGVAPSEFRDEPMPVYRVILDHPKRPHLYVSPVTGDVLKRRNENWRWFDFFWMLHIMDYRDRTDFNHWLLTSMSVLAILTSASGLGLWWGRIPRRKRTVQPEPST
jgi:uncharacterized iron-regulated membrane protein